MLVGSGHAGLAEPGEAAAHADPVDSGHADLAEPGKAVAHAGHGAVAHDADPVDSGHAGHAGLALPGKAHAHADPVDWGISETVGHAVDSQSPLPTLCHAVAGLAVAT